MPRDNSLNRSAELFYTMEPCDCGSVAGLARHRGGMLPVGEALRITHKALDGLAHLHIAPVSVFGLLG